MELTQAYLLECLDYDPLTGVFTWKARPSGHFATMNACKTWNTLRAGKKAGWDDSNGYWQVMINYKRYQAHRVAWLWMTGLWPKDEIDHIDGDPLNNCFSNLREATRSQNEANKPLRKTNTSGVRGVSWCIRRKKWNSNIRINSVKKNLGYFSDINDARQAYEQAYQSYAGEFARVA